MPDATATPTAEPGKAMFTPDEPTSLTPKITGEVHDQARPSNAERIAATVAGKAAATGPAAAPAPAVATPGAAAAPAAAAGGTVDDAAIAAASAKAAELAETKAAVVTEPESFEQRAAKAAELFKTDPLKAMELLGMPLDKAIKQATGGNIDEPTELDKVRAELEKERADRAADQARAIAATAAAQAEVQKQQTVAAIIADSAYPNVNSPDKVEAAFADARAAYKILIADLGRPLNQTEADKLVAYHLKKQDQKLASQEPAGTKPTLSGTVTSNVKTNVVAVPAGTKRSWQQIKDGLKASASKRAN
jgi:hypothetical protein